MIAIIAEVTLDVAYWLFGSFSIVSENQTNFLGLVTVMFHLPGERLVEYISQTMNVPRTGWPWIAFIIFTGGVQFFLLALAVLFTVKSWKKNKTE